MTELAQHQHALSLIAHEDHTARCRPPEAFRILFQNSLVPLIIISL